MIPARETLIAYVKEHGRLVCRSKQSESEYWSVKAADGSVYKVRISGHRYPTGSMTDLTCHSINTTDYDCRRFLELFSLK